MNKEFSTNICTLLCMKQINNRELLYSTGNYSQCLVITHNGKESEKEYMCVCITDYIAIHPKLTQHCKLAVVQLKKKLV